MNEKEMSREISKLGVIQKRIDVSIYGINAMRKNIDSHNITLNRLKNEREAIINTITDIGLDEDKLGNKISNLTSIQLNMKSITDDIEILNKDMEKENLSLRGDKKERDVIIAAISKMSLNPESFFSIKAPLGHLLDIKPVKTIDSKIQKGIEITASDLVKKLGLPEGIIVEAAEFKDSDIAGVLGFINLMQGKCGCPECNPKK